MYNTAVDHEGVSKQDDQEKMEDLKLMTKRMHVKMKDIENNLDQLFRRSKMRKLKMLKGRRANNRTKSRKKSSVIKRHQSVPALNLQKADVVDMKSSKSAADLSEKNSGAKSDQTVEEEANEPNEEETPLEIDFQSLKSVVEYETGPGTGSAPLEFPVKVNRLKQTLQATANSAPWQNRDLGIVNSRKVFNRFVHEHPKLKGIDSVEVAEARRNVIQLENMKHRWASLISKEVHQSMATKLEVLRDWQKRWLIIIKQGAALNRFDGRLKVRRTEQKESQAQIQALSKLQMGWRQNYAKRMDKKHQKTIEILRRRAWIAKMNVAARHRRQNGAIMRSFCNQFVGKSKFVELIRKFKYKVIIMQRFIRAAHQITQSQITAVSKYWSIHESKVLLDMEKAEKKREREKTLDRLRRQRAHRRKSIVTERELQAALEADADSRADIKRAKERKMVGQKVDGLIDLLKRRDKLKKRHGGVVQLPTNQQLPGKKVEGIMKVAMREKAKEEYLKKHAPETLSRFKPATNLVRRETIGEWLKEIQTDFSTHKNFLKEERERLSSTVTLEDMKKIMVSDEKKEAEEKSEKIDLREKKLRELDRPVVFQLYSKYMKDDIIELIMEGVRREEEEEMNFLTQLNSHTNSNLRRRRKKKTSENAKKILSRRLGGKVYHFLKGLA